MTVDDAINIVASRAVGRTCYCGQIVFVDEILVLEIERLRAELAKVPRTFDGAIVRQGMKLWEWPRDLDRKSTCCGRVEVRPGDYATLFSTKEAAEAAGEQK